MQKDTNVRTEKLLNMKNQLVRDGKEWLWHALNRRYWDVEVPPGTDCGRDVDLSTGSTHEKVVLAATTSLLRKVQYPPRPSDVITSLDDQFPSSTSFTTFNEIIARAPVYNFRVDDRHEGLVISGGSFPDFDDEEADWDPAYHLEVHTALLAIAREHGREGWNKARWLVYDKVCSHCPLGLFARLVMLIKYMYSIATVTLEDPVLPKLAIESSGRILRRFGSTPTGIR